MEHGPMIDTLSDADKPKYAAAARALDLVEDGMRLGLGTGSTAFWLVKLLADKVAAGGFSVTCVPTSSQTKAQAEAGGLNVTTLDALGRLDLVIDGADEFDPQLNLIKGAGGALLQEKIVATGSDRMVVIADPSKEVQVLGAFPLSVEVVKFGWKTTEGLIAEMLADVDVDSRVITRRMAGDAPYITDEDHYILDLHLGRIGGPKALALMLNTVPGVVETGLFIDIADAVIVGRENGSADFMTLKGA